MAKIKAKNLGIISDCYHFYTPDGMVATENHILLHQFEALSVYFENVTIACQFITYNAEKVFTTYSKNNISFVSLPVSGGVLLKDKWQIIKNIPKWINAYSIINKNCDIVYLRLPDNVSFPACFYFLLKQKKRFATYTGTWKNYKNEALTWRFEKWCLKNLFNAPYWVYSSKTKNYRNQYQGFSPSYNEALWYEKADLVKNKIQDIKNKNEFNFISVGILDNNKNHIQVIQACSILKNNNIKFKLTIVGDGPLKGFLQEQIEENDLQNYITLIGKKNREELLKLFIHHDFVVQASYSESYGKVPMEGLFLGLLPVISNVGVAKIITGNGNFGFTFTPGNVKQLADIMINLYNSKELLGKKITAGRNFALSNTLESWAFEYYNTVNDFYSL